MAKKTFKQFQNDAKGLTDKQFGKLLDKKGIKRPDVLKKIKEQLNRNQKPFYQKRYSDGGYKTVGTNKRMNSSSDRKKAGRADSKASHRDQMKDFADGGIIKTGKSSSLKKSLKGFNKEERHPRDQKELDRAKAFIKKNPNFGKRDEYGDPIGGPKISKKQLKKNLASNEKDDKITRSESA